MVGNIFIEPENEIDVSGTTTIDCRTARSFYFALSALTTITITNVIPGVETKLYIAATGGGGGTTNVTIQGGTNATMTPSTSQTFTISNQYTKQYSIMGIGGNGFVVGY
jgi:hypothetical protein